VQYPPAVTRKMCNTGPIMFDGDRPAVSTRYCTPTGDRCQLSGRQREEVEAGATALSGDPRRLLLCRVPGCGPSP